MSKTVATEPELWPLVCSWYEPMMLQRRESAQVTLSASGTRFATMPDCEWEAFLDWLGLHGLRVESGVTAYRVVRMSWWRRVLFGRRGARS